MKLYNPKLKKKFIATKKKNVQRHYESIFETTYALEEQYNKDVYNFDLIELEEVLYSFKLTNTNTISNYKSNLSSYLKWCCENEYTLVNNLTRIKDGNFDKYLFNEPKYYMREDLDKWQSQLYSIDEYLISEFIFLGVDKKELKDVRVEDFNFDARWIKLKVTNTISSRYLILDNKIAESINKIIKENHLAETDLLIKYPKTEKIGKHLPLDKKFIRDSGIIQSSLNVVEGGTVTKKDWRIIYNRFPDVAVKYIKELVKIERLNLYRPLDLRKNSKEDKYNLYSDGLKSRLLYEYLVNGNFHFWLDRNVLGLKCSRSDDQTSADILYFLGFKADYSGIFHNKSMQQIIYKLEKSSSNYSEAIRLLKLLEIKETQKKIELDIEAEQVEEGYLVEGGVRYRYIKEYERKAKNRMLAIKEHGTICKACNFDFEAVYGDHGKNYIEIHHIQQLSNLNEATEINPKTDLIPLCANCHRMIHRRQNEVLTVSELIKIMKINKNKF